MLIIELLNIVLPVFIIITAGLIFARRAKVDSKPIATLCLYIFNPALYFNAMVKSTLTTSELLRVFWFTVILFFIFLIILKLTAKIMKYDHKMTNALILSSGFPNSGNYGLPILLFAFGEPGVTVGVIFMSTQVILMNSAGVYFASSAQQGMKEALLNIFRIPGFIAVLFGLVLRLLEVQIPTVMDRPITLLGNAAIPTLLMLLGMSLAKVKIHKAIKFVSLAAFMKLIAYPLVGLAVLGFFFPPASLAGKVLLVCTATPTAATTTLLASQFDNRPELVSTVTLTTTAASLLTISFVLSMLI